jgi:hypothetical protein
MRDVMRALALLLGTACAVRAPVRPAKDPANASAPTGRLAGAPPALRAGVVDYSEVPALREGEPADAGAHHHHH